MTITEIKSLYRIEDVISTYLNTPLTRQGSQYVVNCPFHDDKHASLKVSPSKQIFSCFACDVKGGDMFDFLQRHGKSVAEAKNIITNGSITASTTPIVKEILPVWTNSTPNQLELPDVANLVHFRYKTKPTAFWTYHDNQGNVIGYTCRFDLPEGKKDVLPYTYKTDGIKSKWQWKGFDKPNPLYNLHELHARPEAIVLVVEGEKACDKARELFPQYVCTSWIGGKDNVKHADWTPLANRKIFLWADNDLAGVLAMFGGWEKQLSGGYKRFKGVCEYFEAQFKQIKNSPDFPKKWDIADSDWTPEQAKEYVLANKSDLPSISETPPDELQPVPEFTPVATTPTPKPTNPYFKCLGFENNHHNDYVFFVYRTNTIVRLSASAISKANILTLAPLNYWEDRYPKGKNDIDVSQVADHLITVCSKIGIFNPSKIRGRGAWIENNIPILHCGDHLIVGGIETKLEAHASKFIYEQGQELGFVKDTRLAVKQANELLTMLQRLNWSRDINAHLLAGWIVIAPICGALNWRPHIWLTGSSGAGKSWVMNSIIKRLLDSMAVNVQGSTSEAGIRQYLRKDALPVIFDEAEGDTRAAQERIQSVLELMRGASTSEGGKTLKGSAQGSSMEFEIRSCFAFASIGVNLTQRSDISRISVLEIKPDNRFDANERWTKTQEIYYDTFTDKYIKQFQNRSVEMMPIILANAKIFSQASAIELGNQRAGDQLGALLAGAYSLTSDKVISLEKAKEWIKNHDWTEEKLSENTRDEIKLLQSIVSAGMLVETAYVKINLTVGEMIIRARGDVMPENWPTSITEEIAIDSLKRHGIKIERFDVVFSNSSPFISRILQDTPYSKNYHTILQRIDGAVKVESTTFGGYMKSRGVRISSMQIFGELENPGINQTEIELNS